MPGKSYRVCASRTPLRLLISLHGPLLFVHSVSTILVRPGKSLRRLNSPPPVARGGIILVMNSFALLASSIAARYHM